MVNGRSVRTMRHVKDIAKITPRKEFILQYGEYHWMNICSSKINNSRIRKIGKRNKKTGKVYK